MKLVLFIPVLICALSACMSSKKCATLTDYNYQAVKSTTKFSSPQKVFVNLTETKLGPKARAEQLKSSFLPAIFYWKKENGILVYPDLITTKRLLEENIYRSCEAQKIGSRFDSLKISISNYDNSFVFNSESESYYILVYLITNSSKFIVDNSKLTILQVDVDLVYNQQHLKKTYNIERKSTLLDYDGSSNDVFIKQFLIEQQETERLWTNKLAEEIKRDLLTN